MVTHGDQVSPPIDCSWSTFLVFFHHDSDFSLLGHCYFSFVFQGEKSPGCWHSPLGSHLVASEEREPQKFQSFFQRCREGGVRGMCCLVTSCDFPRSCFPGPLLLPASSWGPANQLAPAPLERRKPLMRRGSQGRLRQPGWA